MKWIEERGKPESCYGKKFHTTSVRRQRRAEVPLKIFNLKGNCFASLICADKVIAELPFPLCLALEFYSFTDGCVLMYCDGHKGVTYLQRQTEG